MRLFDIAQVIVTSYLFPKAKFDLERLQRLEKKVGKERLVVDVRFAEPFPHALILPLLTRVSRYLAVEGGTTNG